jgi:uncharacterized protein YkwD
LHSQNVTRSVRHVAAAAVLLLASTSAASAQCGRCVSYPSQYQHGYAPTGYGQPAGYGRGMVYAQPTAGYYYAQPTAGYYAQPTAYAQQAAPAQPAAAPTQPATVRTDGAVQQVSYVAPASNAAAAAQPAKAETATQAAAPASDPYGFTSWLNGVRAQHGLPAVGYDPNLESWAAANNGQQNARGLGHFVMGSARRQNSAMGPYESIGSMWLASPAHASALLDPSIRYIGLAGSGSYWTFNAY